MKKPKYDDSQLTGVNQIEITHRQATMSSINYMKWKYNAIGTAIRRQVHIAPAVETYEEHVKDQELLDYRTKAREWIASQIEWHNKQSSHNADVFDRVIGWAKERGIDKQEFSVHDNIKNCLEEMIERLIPSVDSSAQRYIAEDIYNRHFPAREEVVSEHDTIDSLGDECVFNMTDMVKLGYHPRLVFEEIMKEIESRIGSWDESAGKWMKDKSDEAKARWYTADFSQCKLEG